MSNKKTSNSEVKYNSMDLELTNACNANCIMCPRDKIKSIGYIKESTFKKIILKLKKENLKSVFFCGLGEPLLHPKIVDFVDFSKKNGIEPIITTNGSLLNKGMQDQLIKKGIKQFVISIPSTTKEIFEKINIGISFENVIKNLMEIIKNKNINVVIQIVISRLNEDNINETIDFCKKNNIKWFLLNITNRGFPSLIKNLIPNKVHKDLMKYMKIDNICPVSSTITFVGYDGGVYLCCNDVKREHKVCNYLDHNFNKIIDLKKSYFNNPLGLCYACGGMDNIKENQIISLNNQVDIILPVFNNYKTTKECIDSIFNNTAHPFRLIIIDDCSTEEDSLDYFNDLNKMDYVTILKNNENLGFIKSINKGIKFSNSNIFVILNNDVVVGKNWLTELKKGFKINKKTGIIAPKVNDENNPYQDIRLQEVKSENLNDIVSDVNKNLKFSMKHKFQGAPFVFGCCMMIKRDVIKECGYFDEIYGEGYYEDIDMCFKARTGGYDIGINNGVFVYHKAGSTFKLEKRNKLLIKNFIIFKKKWKNNPLFNYLPNQLRLSDESKKDKTESPLFVSIEIPIFKHDFLKETIESALGQDYKNYGIFLCVDNDDSNEIKKINNILREYIKNEKITIKYNRKRQGIAKTRKILSSLSNSDYILPLDDDDLITSDCLTRMVGGFEDGVGLLRAKKKFIDENSNLVNNKITEGTERAYPFEEREYYKGATVNITAAYHDYLIKREYYEKTKGWFGFDYVNGMGEDCDIYLKLEEVSKIKLLNKFLFFHRLHKNRFSYFFMREKYDLNKIYCDLVDMSLIRRRLNLVRSNNTPPFKYISSPRVLDLELTTKCNAHCIMCGRSQIKEKSSFDISNLPNIIKIINEFNYSCVVLAGVGEPLLHKNIFKIIKEIKTKTKSQCALNTNGFLLNEENSKNILMSDLDKIIISVHSLNKEIFKKITSLDLEPILKNIKKLLDIKNKSKSSLKVKIQIVYQKHNQTEIFDMIDYFTDLNVDEISIFECIDKALLDLNKVAVKFTPEFIKKILALKNDRITLNDYDNYKLDFYKINKCHIPSNIDFITADCNLLYCSHDFERDVVVGSLLNEDYEDLLIKKNLDYPYKHICKTCKQHELTAVDLPKKLFLYDTISVMCSVYNSKYLKETIDSVLTQTYRNIELILRVDGPSAEEENRIKEIISFYDDSRIKVKYGENLGVDRSRRKIINNLKTHYFLVIDDDDKLHKDCILRLYKEILKDEKMGVVQGGMEVFGDMSAVIRPQQRKKVLGLTPDIFSANQPYLIRKEFYDMTDGWNFDESLSGAGGDSDIFLKMEEISTISYVDDVLYYRRLHRDNLSLRFGDTENHFLNLMNSQIKRRKLRLKFMYCKPQGYKLSPYETPTFYFLNLDNSKTIETSTTVYNFNRRIDQLKHRKIEDKRILFSFQCPAYHLTHIKEMIESVVKQKYPLWELLICFDDPLDKKLMWEIINKYKNNKKIKFFISKKNQGPGPIRQYLSKQSKAKYVMPVDSDDLTSPDLLNEFSKEIKKNNDFSIMRAGMEYLNHPLKLFPKQRKVTNGLTEDIFNLHQPYLLNSNYVGLVGGWHWDKNIFNSGEDSDMFIRLETLAPIITIPKILYYKREHKNNITKKMKGGDGSKHIAYLVNLMISNRNLNCIYAGHRVEVLDNHKVKLILNIKYRNEVMSYKSMVSGLFIGENIKNCKDVFNPFRNPPSRLHLDITYECNLKCKQCHIWMLKDKLFKKSSIEETIKLLEEFDQVEKESLKDLTTDEKKKWIEDYYNLNIDEMKEISLDEKIRVIEEFHQLNPSGAILFNGGEPLKKMDEFFKLSQKCRDLNLLCASPTNGTLIENEEIAEKLIISGPRTLIISLDSPKEEVHDYLRGVKGTYRKVLNAVGLLIKARNKLKPRDNVEIILGCVLMESNYMDFREYVDLGRSLGVDSVVFQMLGETFGLQTKEDKAFKLLFPKDKEKFKNEIDSLSKEFSDDPFVLSTKEDFNHMKRNIDDPNFKVDKPICKSYENRMMINFLGNARLCFFKFMPVGNIRTKSLKELWTSQRAKKLRESMSQCREHCGIFNCHKEDFFHRT